MLHITNDFTLVTDDGAVVPEGAHIFGRDGRYLGRFVRVEREIGRAPWESGTLPAAVIRHPGYPDYPDYNDPAHDRYYCGVLDFSVADASRNVVPFQPGMRLALH